MSHFARGQECIQLRLPHPDAPLAYAYRAHFAPIDHIADRLLVEPPHLGDLGDGQELIWHGLNPPSTVIDLYASCAAAVADAFGGA